MKLKLTVNGKLYEVEVEAEEPQQLQPGYVPPWAPRVSSVNPPTTSTTSSPPLVARRNESVADENKVCRSPISGMVVRVAVETGQSIQLNDVLLVLEAMKMETVITSPVAGKIARINVQASDSVKARQVLVEFD